jgi:antitoxin component YwqK of YwqJK toxin-antitoxin module
MKKFLFFAVMVMAIGLSAQTKNTAGLYVDENNQIFSGSISSVSEGIKSVLTVVNGEVNGEAMYYDTNGKLIESGSFYKGVKNDKWVRYSSTGAIHAIAFYNMGKKHGTWLVYDDAGKKRMEMMYENGEKTGTWFTYDESGEVASSKNYSTSPN